jgi:hypothetical protein
LKEPLFKDDLISSNLSEPWSLYVLEELSFKDKGVDFLSILPFKE